MPVKDSLTTTEQALRALAKGAYPLTVYNDYSSPENRRILEQLSKETGFRLVNLEDVTEHPSPNYRLVLQTARREALEKEEDLIIVESDVIVREDTIARLTAAAEDNKTGLVAAVTVDENGKVNFPYLYASKWKNGCIRTEKRLSFCCTLLTHALLQACDFDQLDPSKNWYDVFISHESVKLGFTNLLLTNTPVLHKPHSSRPWKQLKYTHPLRYYWNKLIHGYDKI